MKESKYKSYDELLCYTTRPIQEAVELHHQRQLRQLELDTARWKAQRGEGEKKAG